MVDMTPVHSSTVEAVGWNAETGELVIEFKNGSRYVYPDAGEGAYNDLLTASSPGSYISRWLKNTHYRKVT
jgi:hypothetical protein